jgi:5-methylcytosine-specific restriction endonuclease McrA
MAGKRKQISKRIRFDIFKRDLFTCQYCGAVPPSVVLHIDHIIPVSKGGTNDSDNLITSCSSCNSGKSAELLSTVPKSLLDRAEEIKEHEAQIRAYARLVRRKNQRIESESWDVVSSLTGNDSPESHDKLQLLSIKRFLEKLPAIDVMDAAAKAHAKFAYSRSSYAEVNRFKYFCGICWNKIKRDGHG